MLKKLLLLFTIFLSIKTYAQELHIVNSNDAWFRTDYYFTEGLSISYLSQKSFLHLPVKLKKATTYYTVLTYNFYTPTSILRPDVMYGDRPYAGYFKFSQLSSTAINSHILIKKGYSIGMMGSIVGAGNVQTYIHEKIGSPTPKGWVYQMSNNFLLDYTYEVTKLITKKSIFRSDIRSGGTLGTDDRFWIGSNVKFPYFKNKWIETFFHANFQSNLVLWNPTLYGGFFNTSPYVLDWKQCNRMVNTLEVGYFLKIKGIGIHSSVTFINKEIKAGRVHKWSNVELIFSF